MRHPTQQEFNQASIDKENNKSGSGNWIGMAIIFAVSGFWIGFLIGYFVGCL